MINGSFFDWERAWRQGREIAGDYIRSGTTITDEQIAWALLCEAARTSRTFRAPPYQGLPTKSSWPDSPDEVTYWQKLTAYLQGEMLELPETESKPPRPSSEQITRADHVLQVWHHGVTLGRLKKKSVYCAACGYKPGLIKRVTGLTVQEVKNAKRRALSEMVGWVAKISQ